MQSHLDFARELIREHNETLDDGDEFYLVDESVIVCPCGNRIEWDGECPNGHVSPIRSLGFI